MVNESDARDLVIIGAGGFAAEAAWAAEDSNSADSANGREPRWKLVGFVVYDPAAYPGEVYSYPVIGTPEEFAATTRGRKISYFCAVGENRIREQEVRRADLFGWTPATLIHPSASISRSARIGQGTYLGPCSVVGPGVQVGNHVLIHANVSIGHDSVVQDYSHICPGARVSGRCHIGQFAFLGSNAVVVPKLVVGDSGVVGANSLAVRAVEPFTTVLGVPAAPFGLRRGGDSPRPPEGLES
jgi:sugar O-acyltransferase (sialic acid O-acetyltransferase NeuD family)